MSEATSTLFEYTEENVKKYAPLGGGVYRLSYAQAGSYYVFYVGQTNSLERRLLEHLSASEVDECIRRHLQRHACYFRYIEMAGELERLIEEKTQIHRYSPSCNG